MLKRIILNNHGIAKICSVLRKDWSKLDVEANIVTPYDGLLRLHASWFRLEELVGNYIDDHEFFLLLTDEHDTINGVSKSRLLMTCGFTNSEAEFICKCIEEIRLSK